MRLYPAVHRRRVGDEMIAAFRQLPPQRKGCPRAACFTSAKLRESWLGPFANAGKGGGWRLYLAVVSNQEVYDAYRIPLSQGNRCTEDDHFGRRYIGDSNRRTDSGTIHSVHSTLLPGVVVGLAIFYAAQE